MSWNEPGKDENPWGKPRGQEGPPDLDEIVRNLQKRFGAIFGGAGSGSGAGKSGGGKGFNGDPGSGDARFLESRHSGC